MIISWVKICNALREKEPKRLSGNSREERKEETSELNLVSDKPDSLFHSYYLEANVHVFGHFQQEKHTDYTHPTRQSGYSFDWLIFIDFAGKWG